jgi:chromosome partitioning protein
VNIITLLNEKGGVGKTTLATHIAAGLAIRGYRVVLADSDPQGNATTAFGAQKEPGFYDLIVRNAKFQDVLRLISPERYALPDDAATIQGSLMLIPSNIESRNIAGSISDAFSVLRRFHQLRDMVDFVVFDTSPTPSLLHASIYMATDGIIYPTKCESWSFDGLRESLGHREQFDPLRMKYNLAPINVLGIVPIMFRTKTVEHSENLNLLKKAFGDIVWKPIPEAIIWAEAAGMKRSLFSIAPDSKATERMWDIIERLEKIYVSA